MPIPTSSIGECVPEVTSPPPSIGIPWRGIAFSSITNATSLRSGPSSLIAAQLVDAGELLVERARPAEPGGDRVRLRRDVVAVQRVADLEPQRVARAEAARRRRRARRPRPRARPRPRPGTSARRRARRCSPCGRPSPRSPSTSPIACVNAGASGSPSRSSERGPLHGERARTRRRRRAPRSRGSRAPSARRTRPRGSPR